IRHIETRHTRVLPAPPNPSASVTKIRTSNSSYVLTAVRDLTRLEMVTEAVRAALEEVAGTSPHLLDELVDEGWGLRYGRPSAWARIPPGP
ncbi:hypothetical protein ACFXJL_29850, partial [Streptomyces sp. NPDC059256]